MTPLPPDTIMRQIADALPQDCKSDIIIIGSLAAGYHFFGSDPEEGVTTKDVDCMLSPNVRAVRNGTAVAERLFRRGWQLRKDRKWDKPGDATTPTEELPFVRLNPPGTTDWFLELMASPPRGGADRKHHQRLSTGHGDFALFSFRFLALVEEDPIATAYGIAVARPEIMALANLLHHPRIGPEPIQDSTDKRSNKDLGRVLALAWLSTARDENALLGWHERWLRALRKRFPKEWRKLAAQAGEGVRALLASPPDLEQATRLCNDGLLARRPVSSQALAATARRLLQDVVEPLESASRARAKA